MLHMTTIAFPIRCQREKNALINARTLRHENINTWNTGVSLLVYGPYTPSTVALCVLSLRGFCFSDWMCLVRWFPPRGLKSP